MERHVFTPASELGRDMCACGLHRDDPVHDVESGPERLKRERDEYRAILHKLVEAQDEIDIEAEKPLHQRSMAPMVKKNEAIKEARRVLEGEECPAK